MNRRFGDGLLFAEAPGEEPPDRFVYDPADGFSRKAGPSPSQATPPTRPGASDGERRVTEPGSPPRGFRPDLDEAVETWSRMNDASILRSVAAVILGFVVLTLASVLTGRLLLSLFGVEPGAESGIDPAGGFITASLCMRLAVSVLAGFLAALAAPRAPRLHAVVLASILVFFSLASLAGISAAGDPYGPAWYPIAMLILGPVGVLLGGALRARRR